MVLFSWSSSPASIPNSARPGLLQILIDVVGSRQAGTGVDLGRNLLAIQVADQKIDAERTHNGRELKHVSSERAVLDRLQPVLRAVETDDYDIGAIGGFQCLDRAQGWRIVRPEDRLDVRIGSENVFSD